MFGQQTLVLLGTNSDALIVDDTNAASREAGA
jgi:hypothetical protein